MDLNEKNINIMDDDDEPDWQTLSILPMARCASKHYKSGCWEYFGQLMQDDVCVDSKNYYCSLCFEGRKLKPYAVASSTTNMTKHMLNAHQVEITPVPRRSSSAKPSPKFISLKTLKREAEDNDTPDNLLEDNSDNLDDHTNYNMEHVDDDMNELLVTKKRKSDDDDDYAPTPTIIRPKRKKILIKPERLHPVNISKISRKSSGSQNVFQKRQSQANLMLFEETPIPSLTEDFDRLFILSLLKEFRKIPEKDRLNAKSDIINVLLKYQPGSSKRESKIENDKCDYRDLNTEYLEEDCIS